jgi:hypothetical protein
MTWPSSSGDGLDDHRKSNIAATRKHRFNQVFERNIVDPQMQICLGYPSSPT